MVRLVLQGASLGARAPASGQGGRRDTDAAARTRTRVFRRRSGRAFGDQPLGGYRDLCGRVAEGRLARDRAGLNRIGVRIRVRVEKGFLSTVMAGYWRPRTCSGGHL